MKVCCNYGAPEPRRQRILISTARICILYRSCLLHYDAFAAEDFHICVHMQLCIIPLVHRRVYERSAPRKRSLRVFLPCQISVKSEQYFIAPVLSQSRIPYRAPRAPRRSKWEVRNLLFICLGRER